MKKGKWRCLMLGAALYPLFAWSCGTDFRDAVYAGWIDFVTGSTTGTLTTAIPLAGG